MVRAVEHMAAERLNIEIPDYNPTLEKTNAYLAGITMRLKAIEDAPALDMTPEDMGERIAAAAQTAREGDGAGVQQVQQRTVEAEIGRAACRERVCEDVSITVGADEFKK